MVLVSLTGWSPASLLLPSSPLAPSVYLRWRIQHKRVPVFDLFCSFNFQHQVSDSPPQAADPVLKHTIFSYNLAEIFLSKVYGLVLNIKLDNLNSTAIDLKKHRNQGDVSALTTSISFMSLDTCQPAFSCCTKTEPTRKWLGRCRWPAVIHFRQGGIQKETKYFGIQYWICRSNIKRWKQCWSFWPFIYVYCTVQ